MRRSNFALVLLLAVTCSPASGAGLRLAYELVDPAFRGSNGLVVSPDAKHLYVGRLHGQVVLQIVNLSATGEPLLVRDVTGGDLGFASIKGIRDLVIDASGSHVYAGTEEGIVVMRRDASSGGLAFEGQVVLPFVQDLEVTADGTELVAVTSDERDDSEGASISLQSSINRYRINPLSGSLEQQQSIVYPDDPAFRLLEVTIANDGSQVFVGTPTDLLVYGRAPGGALLAPARVNIASQNFRSLGVRPFVSADGRSVYVLDQFARRLLNFQRDPQAGALAPRQIITEPFTPLPLVQPRDLALSHDGSILFVASSGAYVQAAAQLFLFSCSSSFARDASSGDLLAAGSLCSLSGNELARHPTDDLFYSVRESTPKFFTDQVASPGGLSVLAPDAGLPLTSIASAVLPSGRMQGDRIRATNPVTAFAAVINAGAAEAVGCSLGRTAWDYGSDIFASVRYHQTDPATNVLLPGVVDNEPFDIPAGGVVTLLLTVDGRSGDHDPTLLNLRYFCVNANSARLVPGVNTFLFGSAQLPTPDLPTAVATIGNTGIVSLADANDTSIFTAATVNIGSADQIRAVPVNDLATVVTGLVPVLSPPAIELTICETNPVTSVCLAPPTADVVRPIATGEVVTYAVWVKGQGSDVPFYPETNRAYIVFVDSTGKVRGGTSVAVRSLTP